jgi:hypothetical protein
MPVPGFAVVAYPVPAIAAKKNALCLYPRERTSLSESFSRLWSNREDSVVFHETALLIRQALSDVKGQLAFDVERDQMPDRLRRLSYETVYFLPNATVYF